MMNVAWPMASGVSTRELADRLGETMPWINARLQGLQRQLLAGPGA